MDKALKALKEIIHLPEKFKEAIYEEFDPVLIINETLEQKLPHLFDQFLDFEGSDENFVAMGTRETTEIIGHTIGEIEDGFIETKDIVPFMRDNVKALVKAASEEKNALMAEMMVVPPIVQYVDRANQNYKKMKEEEK